MKPQRLQVIGWTIFLAVGLAGAGCAAPVEQVVPPSESAPDVGPGFSSTTGGIDGVVVDSLIQPVPNAAVHLLMSSSSADEVANTTTDPAGAFSFSFIEPGTYAVRASGKGLVNASALARVVPGEVIRIVLNVQDRPTQTPYVLLSIKEQIMRCAGSYGAAPSRGTTGTDADETVCGPSQTGASFDVPEGFAYVLSETTWPQKSEMLDLYFGVANQSSSTGGICTSGCTVAETWGPPVLRMSFLAGEQKTPPSNAASGTVWAPLPEKAFRLTVGAYYAGMLGKDIDQNAGAVCGSVYGHCVGVGYTVEFRYTHYVTVFVHGLVDDIEHYSALMDE